MTRKHHPTRISSLGLKLYNELKFRMKIWLIDLVSAGKHYSPLFPFILRKAFIGADE